MAYSSINKAADYQVCTQYTGDGTTSNVVTGVGFQSDLTWIKDRSATTHQMWFDAVRGVEQEFQLNSGAADTFADNSLTAWSADGFTVGNSGNVNTNTNKYISFNWKAGTTSGIAGSPSITPTGYSFNSTAGFSCIKWTGTEANGTLPHGLGVAPDMIITKTVATGSWYMYTKALGATKALFVNDSGAAATASTYWNDTAPDANLFTVGTSAGTNDSGQTMLAYCFAGINTQMFKTGTYIGNNDGDGPFVYTNHRPSLLMIKRTDTTSNWRSVNNKDGVNGDIGLLHPNLTDQESAGDTLDILCNGFKIFNNSTDWNADGGTYVYCSWGQPMVSNNGVPVLGRTGGVPT